MKLSKSNAEGKRMSFSLKRPTMSASRSSNDSSLEAAIGSTSKICKLSLTIQARRVDFGAHEDIRCGIRSEETRTCSGHE
jgi:hypothetical protein